MIRTAGGTPVSARLGHSSVASTLDTHTGSIQKLDRTATEQVSRLLFTVLESAADDNDHGCEHPQ
jgi:hypothetical protein